MIKFFQKAVLFVLVSSIVFSLAATASAAAVSDAPKKGIAPKSGILATPGGTLTNNNISESKLTSKDRIIIPPMFYYQYWCTITSKYDGYHDRGEIACGTNGKSTKDTLGFSLQRSVSNTFNVSAKFPISVVDTTVGFSHSWSESKTWSYSSEVSPNKTVHIGYKEWYHVNNFNWTIVKVPFSGSGYTVSDKGTGWSAQWFKPQFYSWET